MATAYAALINRPKNKLIRMHKEIEINLDKTHYGLDKAKARILEYLAVKKHSSDVITPIICLVGPPGVGKTTFAHSIAKSLGRNFVSINVGGVDDEAIIKGHIRTIKNVPGEEDISYLGDIEKYFNNTLGVIEKRKTNGDKTEFYQSINI